VIIVDTNVASELLRPRPDPKVIAWAEDRFARSAAIAATTAAELLTGVLIMPVGARRRRLAREIDELLARIEVVPFDHTAARHYADIVAARRAAGRPIMLFDVQIAATARAHGAAVATRDIAGFEACGVEVIDPWSPPKFGPPSGD
jgi:predicted nucleic acid-binding protein